jgi:putative ABC transport system permease protein
VSKIALMLIRDLQLGFRVLRTNPGFTAVAILALALGIGVSTALFSVVYGVWLNGYPYGRAGEILYARARGPSGEFADSQNGVFQQREFLEFARVAAVRDSVAYTLGRAATVVGDHGPELVTTFYVSGNTFSFLGVAPMLGRPIQPSDIRLGGGAEQVVVLSFNLWRRMFHSDPDVVGRTVELSGVPHVVIGVMPRRFGWGSNSVPTNDGMYLPLSTADTDARVRAWVRLHDGISASVAAQQFHALFRELAKQPGSFPQKEFVTDLREFVGGTGETARYVTEMRASLRLLLFAVGLLLLIACSNVANLQLARSSVRAREVAMRLALGASRWRIFRQLLTENVLLGVAGGLFGVSLAIGLTRLIAVLIPRGYVPSESEIAINVPVLLAGAAISVASGVLFGMAPAIHGATANLNDTLKDTGVSAGGRRGARTRNLLVTVEVALSVVLLMGAGLAMRGYAKLGQEDLGFNPQRLFEIGVRLFIPPGNQRGAQPTEFADFLRDLPERVRRLPAVESAGILQRTQTRGYQISGEARQDVRVPVLAISADYLRTMGIVVRTGREISEADVVRREPVAVINETARLLWPAGQSPVGTRIMLHGLGRPTDPPLEVTVVGVVRNEDDAAEMARPAVFVPYTVNGLPFGLPSLIVRTRHDDPLKSADDVRAQAFALNPRGLLLRPVDLAAQFASGRLQPRFNMALFSGLAAIALALSAAGIFAVLSYQVAGRRREIGIRLALGAGSGRIFSMILGSGAVLVGSGLAVGVAAALAITRLVKSQIFTVPQTDPVALVVAVTILAIVAACACYLPARRACRVDPLAVLRSD